VDEHEPQAAHEPADAAADATGERCRSAANSSSAAIAWMFGPAGFGVA
jgi:hypothetical protein